MLYFVETDDDAPRYCEYEADAIQGFYLMRFTEDIRGQIGQQMTDRIVTPLTQTTTQA